jgi:uncharacterized RDD family membrane protein YckC
MPGDPSAAPAFEAAGPPREALAGFWRRLVSALLDWLLVGTAAAIGELFGVDAPRRRPRATASISSSPERARSSWSSWPTSPGSTPPPPANRSATILGIRVLDADTGRSLPYARAFVRALMSNLVLPWVLWMLWDPRKRTWHDIVADSLVVKASVYRPGEFGRPAR